MPSEVPATIINIQLITSNESPEEVRGKIQKIRADLSSRFESASILISTETQSRKVVSSQKKLSQFCAEYKEAIFGRQSGSAYEAHESLQNTMPRFSEKLLIFALKIYDAHTVCFLLEYNEGITVKVLKKAAEYVNDRNFYGQYRPHVAREIVDHPKVTDEILWMLLRSDYKTVQKQTIPKANQKMLSWLEKQTLAPSTVGLVARRKAQLAMAG